MYFFLKNWKGIVLVILISATLSIAYDKVYTRGYEKAAIEYEAKIKEYNTKVLTKIARIEDTSDLLMTQNISIREQSRLEFEQLNKSLAGKQLYNIVAGKCVPSKEFADAVNTAIKKANNK